MNLKEVLETIDRVCDLKGDLTHENFYSKVVNPLKKENCYLDSNSGATKDATIETGYSLRVPLFIKEGEHIIVSTLDGKYVSRA